MTSFSNNPDLTKEGNGEQPFLSVSELNTQMRDLLEQNYHFLKIAGEISSLTRHSSGHIYITLKDDSSVISVVIFKNLVKEHYKDLKIGDSIRVWGGISLYVKSGKYSIQAYHIASAGQGELFNDFLTIKNKLESQGLFNSDRKKSLPAFIRNLAVITSHTGAAVQDFLTIFQNHQRLPIRIILIPTIMQGSQSAKDIIGSIHSCAQIENLDAILITRGGGAYEDLDPFNNEQLAHTVYDQGVPILSAVGHERDFTILDFVADLRFSTPSDAAQYLASHQNNIIEEIAFFVNKIRQYMIEKLAFKKQAMLHYSPSRILLLMKQQISLKKILVANLLLNLKNYFEYYLGEIRSKLNFLEKQIQQQNPLTLSKKGVGLILNKDLKPITSIEKLKNGDELNIEFINGLVKASITDITVINRKF